MFLVQFVVSLRISDEDMEISDEAAHNEEAYVIWGQGEKLINWDMKDLFGHQVQTIIFIF